MLLRRVSLSIRHARHRQACHRGLSSKAREPLVNLSTTNKVTTITMNNPKRLNGWTENMMKDLFAAFDTAAADDDCAVAVLTGADPYYCAGVSLADTIKPMHPKTLYRMIVDSNQLLFDSFLNFPKPIIVAANGPAIGACVTSATLCDAIVASDKATFSTPFARLGISPEGCSSVWFERIMGAETAQRMLGPEGWQPTGAEAKQAGFVHDVVPHDMLLSTAQALGETWVAEGRTRTVSGRTEPGLIEELKAVNAKESVDLANAFLSVPFLQGQESFLREKGKTGPATMFQVLRIAHPLWRPMVGDA